LQFSLGGICVSLSSVGDQFGEAGELVRRASSGKDHAPLHKRKPPQRIFRSKISRCISHSSGVIDIAPI